MLDNYMLNKHRLTLVHLDHVLKKYGSAVEVLSSGYLTVKLMPFDLTLVHLDHVLKKYGSAVEVLSSGHLTVKLMPFNF